MIANERHPLPGRYKISRISIIKPARANRILKSFPANSNLIKLSTRILHSRYGFLIILRTAQLNRDGILYISKLIGIEFNGKKVRRARRIDPRKEAKYGRWKLERIEIWTDSHDPFQFNYA